MHELTIGMETLRDLGGKFTRGGQNERAHPAWHQTAAVGEEPAEYRQSKSCRLSRASLSDAEKIMPARNRGDSFRLYWRGRFIACMMQSTK